MIVSDRVSLTLENDDQLLTIAEVARRLRLSRSAVYNLIWREALPYVNLACASRRVPRIRQADLEQFIRARMHSAPPNPND